MNEIECFKKGLRIHGCFPVYTVYWDMKGWKLLIQKAGLKMPKRKQDEEDGNRR